MLRFFLGPVDLCFWKWSWELIFRVPPYGYQQAPWPSARWPQFRTSLENLEPCRILVNFFPLLGLTLLWQPTCSFQCAFWISITMLVRKKKKSKHRLCLSSWRFRDCSKKWNWIPRALAERESLFLDIAQSWKQWTSESCMMVHSLIHSFVCSCLCSFIWQILTEHFLLYWAPLEAQKIQR